MKKFKITTMSCEHCAKRICDHMEQKHIRVTIDTPTKVMTVIDSNGLTSEEIIAEVKNAGYEAEVLDESEPSQIEVKAALLNEVSLTNVSQDASDKFFIGDISCANCAITISKQLEKNDLQVAINAGTKQMIVQNNPKGLSTEEIVSEIKKAGYTAEKIKHHNHHHDHGDHFSGSGNRKWYQLSPKWKLIFSIVAFILAEAPMVFHELLKWHVPRLEYLMNPWFQMSLATLTMYFIGLGFFQGAWNAFRNKSTTMDTLVTVGSIAAYALSWMQMIIYHADTHVHYFFEATVAILALIYLGHYLEHKASSRTNDALKELTKLNAPIAHVINDENIIDKVPSEVNIQERIVIYKGETIPLDGIVISGSGFADESMITGEAFTVEKEAHSIVTGGTILKQGELIIEVRKRESEGTLAAIITAVETAQFEKPEIQKMADKISAIFVPVIIVIALLAFAVWYFIIQAGVWQSVSVALSVVVISCPCAFGLATPLSILLGSSLAAKKGILYKSGATFEQVKKIDAVCFDKTGTLTYGTPQVARVYGDVSELASVVYTAESSSEHPLAFAVKSYLETEFETVALDSHLNIEEISGKGLVVDTANSKVVIGSYRFIEEQNIDVDNDAQQFIQLEANAGSSLVFVAENHTLKGIFAVRDKLKPEAKTLIQKLNQYGIETYMITGDMKVTALAIAAELHLDEKHVFSEVKPIEKLDKIKALQNEGKIVAFVGDGINDAPALAQANLGIAVGTGSKVALSAADITLVGGNIGLIDEALQISSATLRNIYTNFAWALSYNVLAIPIAVFGLLSPTWAAAFMAFSDIVVVLNALRLKLFKKR